MPPPSLLWQPLVFGVGLVLGGAINWAIYTWAFHARAISPWSKPDPKAPPRLWSDRLPVIGWLGLRREAALHGRWFWLRPLAIEVCFGLFAVWLWRLELAGGLFPAAARQAGLLPGSAVLATAFAAHLLLTALVAAATFIDFDEKTIPDEITLPGVILGLALAALAPGAALLPAMFVTRGGQLLQEPLLFTSESVLFWSADWNGWRGLVLGLAILGGWCLALVPATATLRRGWLNAVRYYWASMGRTQVQFGGLYRGPAWRFLALLFVVLALGTNACWCWGGERWPVLLSAIVGMGFGMGLIWAMRVVGWLGLRVEAMGFGDATLMAVIGAFLGWQATLVVFLLSPAAAVFVAVGQTIFTGRRDIAFGPYLSLSAVVVIANWAWLWEDQIRPRFDAAGVILPLGGLVCLCLMLGMLMLWRNLKQLLFGEPAE